MPEMCLTKEIRKESGKGKFSRTSESVGINQC